MSTNPMLRRLQGDMNCWISFVLYAVTGRMGKADSLMREHGDAVRRHAKRQRQLVPIDEKPLFRGLLLDDGKPVANNAFFEFGTVAELEEHIMLAPGRREARPEAVIGDDGCVPHAIDIMSFVSHSEDLECAQWFATPEASVSGLLAELHPTALGYVLRLEKPPSTVLWHHTWQSAQIQGEKPIPLAWAAQLHPEIEEFADQFEWNATTQSEVILEPSRERLKLEPVGEVDVKALDSKFCHPGFLAQLEAQNG